MDKKCAECGDDFSCSNDISCWCADFPKLSKNEVDERDCLCRNCLLIRYRKKILDVWHKLKVKYDVLLKTLKSWAGSCWNV